MTAGIDRALHHLGMAAPSGRPRPEAPRIVTMWVPAATVDGLWYPSKPLGKAVAAGEVLGEIRDMFGTVLDTVTARDDGFLLYQLSSLAVNRGEALLGTGTPLE
jgi:hypothetical protein